MNIDANALAVIMGLIVNVIAIASIVTRSNVRLERRLTRVETSVAFLLQIMKVNLASSHPPEGD